MFSPVAHVALDQMFIGARSHNTWRDEPVPPELLEAVYGLACLGPTSANCSPARFLFVQSPEARARLARHMFDMNKAKAQSAPVVAIIAQDTRFYDEMGDLFPQRPEMAEMFRNNPGLAAETASRNSTLEGAYLMCAARALGLDTGPMSGFDNAGLDQEFFPDGRWKSNFVCCLGRGDPSGVWPKLPRLPFERACAVV